MVLRLFEKEVGIDTVEHSCGRERDRPHSLVCTASVPAAAVPQMLAKVHSAAATTVVPLVDHLDACIRVRKENSSF